MFTFTEIDQKAKDPMAFPARLFTLPVSTPFLFWWLLLAGLAAVIVLYASWVYFVRPASCGSIRSMLPQLFWLDDFAGGGASHRLGAGRVA